MKKAWLGIALACCATGSVLAAVDPEVSVLDLNGVVANCELVAETQKEDPNPNAGKCVGATQVFLDAAKASSPTGDALDQIIADLIDKLVPLATEDESCNELDDEVARAIRLASSYATTKSQQEAILGIGDSVAECGGASTSAIIPEEVPASRTV